MADPFGDQDIGLGGPGKRPAPTIEGTATEVAAEAVSAGHDEEPDAQEGDTQESEADAAAAPTEPAGPERRVPPPPAASMSELKGFVTHLAAGLLGGLIGVIALAFAWNLLPTGKGESSAELGKIKERIAKLETAIDKGVAGTKSAAAAIAFANLSSAVAEGRPFAIELAAIKSFVPDPGDLGPLPAFADKGIPTVPELVRSFAASRDSALAAATPAPSGSILDRLLASASTLVKIKRVDEAATGDSPSAVLARAEALLDKGDLAASVKQVEALDGAPREAFSVWLDQANARLGADDILQRLEATLLASASSAPQKAQD